MKSNGYCTVFGWMANELELVGNSLLIFALIYGFSQDGESTFKGTRDYIAETFNISEKTADRIIAELEKKDLIYKSPFFTRNGQSYEYFVNMKKVESLLNGDLGTKCPEPLDTSGQNVPEVRDNLSEVRDKMSRSSGTKCPEPFLYNNNIDNNRVIISGNNRKEKDKKEKFLSRSKIDEILKDYPIIANDEIVLKDFSDYFDMREAMKVKGYATEASFRRKLTEVINLSGNNPDLLHEIVNQSIANQWTGFYLPKQASTAHTQVPPNFTPLNPSSFGGTSGAVNEFTELLRKEGLS